MFDDKDNLIGVVLLALCAVVAGVLFWAIVTDSKLEYTGPAWLTWVLGILFFGGLIYGMWQGISGRFRSGGPAQWPNPGAGQRPWWKFWDRN